MEVSGSGVGSKPDRSAAAAAYESIDNMGKEKEEDKEEEEESESSGLWGSESGSDKEEEEEEECGQSESDCEDPMDPIWNLIYNDDLDGLMKFLNLPNDRNHCSDYNYEQLKYAFRSSCYLNKLRCLKALLDCGVDWFAENAVGESLLYHPIIADRKNAAKLVIAYAKEKNVADKLLGSTNAMGMTPMDPIWNLIYDDDSDGLMKILNVPNDRNHCSDYNYEQLDYAFRSSCSLNKLRCLKALLDCGVDWFARNALGERLLQAACVADRKNAAKLVIAYAKEKNVADKLLGSTNAMGMTPLHYAASCGSCNVIQLLLDEGADPCNRGGRRLLPSDYANPGTKAWNLLVNAVLNKVKSN